MKKRIASAALVMAMICACVLLAGCSSSLKGTTWYYVSGGEVKSISFSDNAAAVTSDGLSMTYEVDGDTVTLSAGPAGTKLTRTKTNGVDTLVADTGEIMYQDQAIPQKQIDDQKSANVEEADAKKQQFIEQLSDDLIGSYHYELENSYYDYTDTRDVVFNDDGTWMFRSVIHTVDRAGGNVNVSENTTEKSGTWEIVYDDAKVSVVGTTLSQEEICDSGAFALKLTKADGTEITIDEQNALNIGISVKAGNNGPALDIWNQYEKVS